MPIKNIAFARPMLGDEEQSAVHDVLSGPILVHGPKATEFEARFANFTNAPEAVSVASCTAGMHLVYTAWGLGPGDEVVVPAQTHVATAHAIEFTGAKAVFVDAEMETGNIDIDKIASAITPRTKAITVVHYLGVPVDMPQIVALAQKHDLRILEDCALALGAYVDKKHVGLHGDAGVFSFYPVKHITTAEGGMVILKNRDLAKTIRLLKAFGVDRTHQERTTPGVYDSLMVGLNYRMNEIAAVLGIVQLRKLPSFLVRRKDNYEYLRNQLEGLPDSFILPQPSDDHLRSSYYCMGLLLDESLVPSRAVIREQLQAKGIGTSIYYPHPVPRMHVYKEKYDYNEDQYSVAARISDGVICLPIGPHLDIADMEHISAAIKIVLANKAI